ncbi:MAG: type II toxin-antitoxin system VapC family toxin [Fimbriimonadales bacterium]|jgi:predicted nucleic acid-binding protein
MNGYLLDTDAIIAILRASPEVRSRLEQAQREGKPVFISALSYYETKRGLIRAGAIRQAQDFEKLCERIGILTLTKAVLDRAAQMYADLAQQGQLIEDADILIGATAIEYGLVLITGNRRHFARIEGLLIEDWMVRE